jgi:hypothetical protein
MGNSDQTLRHFGAKGEIAMTHAQNFGGNVDALVKQTVRPQPRSVEVVYLPVTTGDLTEFLAQRLTATIHQLATKEVILDTKDVIAAFDFLVLSRVAFCAGVKTKTHPKDIEYPAFMLPVLQSVGKYVSANKGYEIIPVPSDEKFVEQDDSGKIVGLKTKTPEILKPAQYDEVMRTLRSMGVAMSYGLPMDRYATDDSFYRMEIADEMLYGPENVPAPTTVMARVLLRLNYLSNLFGRADQAYNAVAAFKSAIDEVVFSHVRGPRVHSVA